jgi:DNA-binding MarR family transcriptional regulator
MGTSGELIRLINYVDDITATLRRISAFVAAMESDERKRLAESLKVAGSNLDALVVRLEKGGQ